MNVNIPESTNKTTSDCKDLGNHVRDLMHTNITNTVRVEEKNVAKDL